MTARHSLRHAAHRALGTPDASEVTIRLEAIERSLAELSAAVQQLADRCDAGDARLAEAIDATQHQVDQLRDVALEHTEALDRLVTGERNDATG